MTPTFIQHELKAFWRSKNTSKSIGVRIVMGILILYLLLNVLVVAFFLDKILDKAFPNEELIPAFGGIILYYFLYDLLMRLQLQELPTLRVQPYLHLKVKRNSLVNYLSATSLLSFFNLWPFILFLPFIFKVIVPDTGMVAGLAFIVSIIGLTIFNNYLSLYIKRRANLNGFIFIGAMAVVILINLADFWWHLFSIQKVSNLFFGHLITMPYLMLLPVLLGIGMYIINFAFLKQNLYLEELSTKKEAHKSSTEIPFLDRFGRVGDLVANEIKLIIRNKRSKSAFIMSAVFLFYGLIFYTNAVYAKHEWPRIFCGMFMTGFFIISYGQFMFSWQASHFDGILTSKVSFKDFIKAKYLLFTLVSTLAFLLTTAYGFISLRIIVFHFVMYLWNLGVNTTIVLFFANRNYKRIDLSKGASFNWEGVGATQLLMGLPLMLGPYIIYGPLAYFNQVNVALIVMGAIGLAFILTRNYWIKELEADFNKKKFTIAEGFRNK
jgi:hypothetical protein